jgi:hypothetical protein
MIFILSALKRQNRRRCGWKADSFQFLEEFEKDDRVIGREIIET